MSDSPQYPIKRFLLFRYSDYYPSGGWGDFEDSFDSLDDAVKAHQKLPYINVATILDTQTGQEIVL